MGRILFRVRDIHRAVIQTYLLSLLIYFLSKFLIRPLVLAKEIHGFGEIVVMSIPNFIEAIIGTLNIAGLLLMAKRARPKIFSRISMLSVYFLATALAAGYVITQELNLFSLGGSNVTDTFDILASGIGLFVALVILVRFGFLKKD